MSRLHDTILAAAVAEVQSRTEWDEFPCLYFLRVEHGGGLATLRPLAFPDGLWRLGSTADVLTRLANDAAALTSAFRSAIPPDLYGAALRAEAWDVVTERGASEAEIRDVRRAAYAHRLSSQPGREEVRTVTVVDRAGITYTASQRRSDGQVEAHILYRRMIGQVPDALDTMVTALLGVELAARPDVPEAFWPRDE